MKVETIAPVGRGGCGEVGVLVARADDARDRRLLAEVAALIARGGSVSMRVDGRRPFDEEFPGGDETRGGR